jgi:hypothetical protein
MTAPTADDVRARVLDRMERQDRWFRAALLTGAGVEAVLLLLVLWLADLQDRTHALIVVTSILGYTIVVLGLVALGARMSRALSALAAAIDGHAP